MSDTGKPTELAWCMGEGFLEGVRFKVKLPKMKLRSPDEELECDGWPREPLGSAVWRGLLGCAASGTLSLKLPPMG